MARLPAPRNQESQTKTVELTRLEQVLLAGLSTGMDTREIAKKLAPDNRKKQKRLVSHFRRRLATNPELAGLVGLEAKGAIIEGLIPMAEAIARRASKGRPDAVKLAFEATGFHNPRVQHDHSGDITVKVELPRPAPVADDDSVVDADVVEE